MSLLRDVLSLNENWCLLEDAGDIGINAQWHQPEKAPAGSAIQLPYHAKSVAPKTSHDHTRAAIPHWLFHRFSLPAEAFQQRHCELHFEGFPAKASIWLNGQHLSTQSTTLLPFSLPVHAHLRDSDNFLAIRLDDAPQAIGNVALRCMPRQHIEAVQIHPDIRRKRIVVQIQKNVDLPVRLQVLNTENQLIETGEELILDFPEFQMWRPQKPTLYTLQVELLDQEEPSSAKVVDCLQTPFGMREFTVKDQRFYLNNRPLYLKIMRNANRQMLAYRSDEAHRLIACARQAGFNALYTATPFPENLLEAADAQGILVLLQSPGLRFDASPEMPEAVQDFIWRHGAHPALVVWRASFPALPKPRIVPQADDEALPELQGQAATLRSLDPSRLIFMDSESLPGPGLQYYSRPYRSHLEIMDTPVFHHAAPAPQEAEHYLRKMGSGSRLSLLSAFGYPTQLEQIRRLATENNPERQAQEKIFQERNLDRVFGQFNNYLKGLMQLEFDAIRDHLDALRNNPNLAGYCYRSCYWKSAMEQDAAPALYQSMQELQACMRPLIDIATTNLKPREEAPLTIYLVNEKRLEGRAELSLQLVGPTNQVLWKKRRSVKLPKPGKALWSGSVAASGSTGTHRFVVRVSQENQLIAQNHIELYVMKPNPALPEGQERIRVHMLDPNGQWSPSCNELFKPDNLLAPIHIIPPLANSILAYPENELMQILAQVEGGAIALFFSPPPDWNSLAQQLEPEMSLSATSRPLCNDSQVLGHYAKLHPIFEGLPARDFMRMPYRNILPQHSFVETGEEDISGHMTLERPGRATGSREVWWGNNILVRRYGSGRIVFLHMPLLEHHQDDPVADRMLLNLVQHFERRSVPSQIPLPIAQSAVEWLRLMRNQKLRRWMVIGNFPNWELQGHDAIYPPEEQIDFQAAYPGWDRVVPWRPWHTHSEQEHLLDFEKALCKFTQQAPMHDYATAYAYAEFSCDRRVEVEVSLGVQNAMKVWVNGQALFSHEQHVSADSLGTERFNAYLRQGRNSLLVKCSKIPGPFRFSLDFDPMDGHPLVLNWWK